MIEPRGLLASNWSPWNTEKIALRFFSAFWPRWTISCCFFKTCFSSIQLIDNLYCDDIDLRCNSLIIMIDFAILHCSPRDQVAQIGPSRGFKRPKTLAGAIWKIPRYDNRSPSVVPLKVSEFQVLLAKRLMLFEKCGFGPLFCFLCVSFCLLWTLH